MKTVAIEDQADELALLLEEVKRGEEVVVTDHNQPVAKIVPIKTPPPRSRPRFGALKGKISMAPDFDAPLEDFKEYME